MAESVTVSLDNFVLINLVKEGTFTFQMFPAEITLQDKANWEAQETTTGVKPLFYANREPRTIALDEVYLDGTDSNEALTDRLTALQALMQETPETGTPPPLLAVWGQRREREVLTALDITETFFNQEGVVIRAKIRLELMQLQPDGEATGSRQTS